MVHNINYVNIIISVKPKYAAAILSGRKKYEYRKSIFKRSVNKIYVYTSSPQRKFVGYFFYDGFIRGTPEYIWEHTSAVSGISFPASANQSFFVTIKIQMKLLP